MLFLIVIAILPLIFKLYTNYRAWEKNIPINHSSEFWKRMVPMYLPVAIVWTGYTEYSFIIGLFVSLLLLGSYFWFLFDGIYNIIRRYPWLYMGTIDIDESKFDNFLRKLKPWQHLFLKLGLIAISSYLYFSHVN